jgi:hypothetical protein
MGCHTGETRPDHLGAGPAFRDWAQALASRTAVYVGQTGYGLGGRHTYDLSEPLVGGFGELVLRRDASGHSPLTAGQALAVSKHRQLATDGVPGVYLSKALQEATFFGLPMYQVGATSSPADSVAAGFGSLDGSSAPTLQTDPATGARYSDVQTTPTYDTVITPEGRYLNARGHQPQMTHRRPVLPKSSKRVTSSGFAARGVTLEGYATADQTDFDPLIAKPLLSAGQAVSQPGSEQRDVEFPAVPAKIVSTGGQDTLVTMLGSFSGRKLEAGHVIGRHRRVTNATWRVWYSNDADVTAPSWTTFDVATQGSSATITARVSDDSGPQHVADVSALYLDESQTWKLVRLVRDADDPEVFAKTFAFQGPGIEVIGQVRDGSGNTRFLTNKGGDFAGTDLPSTGSPLYDFDGPYSPYLGKTIQAGSTIPIKFGLSLDGVPVVDPGAVSGIASYPVDCVTRIAGAGAEARQEDLAGLTVHDLMYHYNWQTPSAYRGGCAVLDIALDDGSSHPAFFRFKT